MSALERKWWFIGIVSFLTILVTRYLIDSAGFPAQREYSWAQWAIFILSYAAVWRSLSFCGWLIAVAISPAYATKGTTLPMKQP